MAKNKLEIIGIHECIHIAKHGIHDLPCKTDTGAYNSAIDCCFAEEKISEEGSKVLTYILLNPKNEYYTGRKFTTKNFKVKKVRSSNGIETLRYQVKLRIELKGRSFRTTFNLSHRSAMRYPVLLGRKMLADRFLVDVSRKRKLKKSKTK